MKVGEFGEKLYLLRASGSIAEWYGCRRISWLTKKIRNEYYRIMKRLLLLLVKLPSVRLS